MELPRIGEVWWLCDTIALVIGFRCKEGYEYDNVVALVLLDLDEVFDPGEELETLVMHVLIRNDELAEQNRKIA